MHPAESGRTSISGTHSRMGLQGLCTFAVRRYSVPFERTLTSAQLFKLCKNVLNGSSRASRSR